jgi:hypothetical protein
MLDLGEPPSYEDAVKTYGLTPLAGGLDLAANEARNNLVFTVDFDYQLGDKTQNAFHRLLMRWRYNEPMLRANFDFIKYAFNREDNLEAELNEVAATITAAESIERYHKIREEVGVLSFGRDAAAGCIMVVLTNLLRRLWVDLNKPDSWTTGGTHIESYSIGAIMEAAAANFRHHDEWARTEPPIEQQLRSIPVIAAALKEPIAANGSRHPFRGNMCPEVLLAVSGGDFKTLNQRVFEFARALAGVDPT